MCIDDSFENLVTDMQEEVSKLNLMTDLQKEVSKFVSQIIGTRKRCASHTCVSTAIGAPHIRLARAAPRA